MTGEAEISYEFGNKSSLPSGKIARVCENTCSSDAKVVAKTDEFSGLSCVRYACSEHVRAVYHMILGSMDNRVQQGTQHTSCKTSSLRPICAAGNPPVGRSRRESLKLFVAKDKGYNSIDLALRMTPAPSSGTITR